MAGLRRLFEIAIVAIIFLTRSPGSLAATSDSNSSSDGALNDILPLNKTHILQPVDSIFSQAVNLLEQLEAALTLLLSPITFPLSFVLKILLLPVIFLVLILLLIVQTLLDFIVYGLVTIVIGPLLKSLGLGDTLNGIQCLLQTIDVLLYGVQCLLSQLTYFANLLPGGCRQLNRLREQGNHCDNKPLALLLLENEAN